MCCISVCSAELVMDSHHLAPACSVHPAEHPLELHQDAIAISTPAHSFASLGSGLFFHAADYRLLISFGVRTTDAKKPLWFRVL